jgi:septal ring factor EnvC (AmiA/AmiB activator)
MTTDTPRTDEQIWTAFHHHEMCDVVDKDFARQLELELAVSLDNQCKAQAEIKEIRNALGDDGRRTHKEILEMAFKASGWREWKKKYIDLRNAHIAEGQDPAGTIWEHADKLQKELKETKAEIAKLNHQLLKTECDLLQSQDINSFLDTEFRIACKRAEKAEAESESRRQSLAFALNEIKKAEAEVERLKLLLTEKNYLNSNNYNQIKEAINPTDK